MYDFCHLFFMFFCYSILGYIVETIFCSLIDKKIVFNRGFLIGPYLPIYGVASVLMTLLLTRYQSDAFTVFIMAAFICTTVEYLTSYVLEKLFKTRWWDYTNQSFNVNGRVCLKNSVLFGVGGVVIVYFLNDYFEKLVGLFSRNVFIGTNIVLMILFFTDVVISYLTISKIRKNSELVKKDMTEEIKEQVKEELEKHLPLTKRLLNSFPRVFLNIRDVVKKIDITRKNKK